MALIVVISELLSWFGEHEVEEAGSASCKALRPLWYLGYQRMLEPCHALN